jgi:glycosyltransferase involved in cell wall biosynthesis
VIGKLFNFTQVQDIFHMYKKEILFVAHQKEDFIKYRMPYVENLLIDGHKVVVLIPLVDVNNLYTNDFIKDRSNLNFYYYNYNRSSPKLSDVINFLIVLKKVIRLHKVDLIFSIKLFPNSVTSIAFVIFYFRLRKVRKVCLVAGLGELSKKEIKFAFFRSCYFFLLNKFDSIIVQNRFDKTLISAHTDFNKVVLTNGSGISSQNLDKSFNELAFNKKFNVNLSSSDRIFFCAARLTKSKGIFDLINAFSSKEIDPNAFLIIVGWFESKDEENLFFNMIKGVSRIKYLGNHRSLDDIFNFVHFSVLISTYGEGLSRFLIESLKMGKPILTSNVPGCIDLVHGEIDGHVVNDISIENIVSNVNHLCRLTKEEYCKKSNLAKSVFQLNYSIDVVYNQYLKIFFKEE